MEAIELARATSIADHQLPSHTAIVRALVSSEMGDVEESQRMLDELVADRFEGIPYNMLRVANLALLALISIEVKHLLASEMLLTMLEPYEGQVISGGGNTVVYGAASHFLGLLASKVKGWDEANRYFDSAIAVHSKMRCLTTHCPLPVCTSHSATCPKCYK